MAKETQADINVRELIASPLKPHFGIGDAYVLADLIKADIEAAGLIVVRAEDADRLSLIREILSGDAPEGFDRLAALCGAMFGPSDKADRAALPATEETRKPAEHTGGNAEDCPACDGRRDLPYPFICPGEESPARRLTSDNSASASFSAHQAATEETRP